MITTAQAAQQLAQEFGLGPQPADVSVGLRWMTDIPYEPPLPPLVPPFIAASGITIVYGRGGVGKGLLGTYFAGKLTEAGRTVGIVDYEGRRSEWARRVRDMGLTEEQLAHICYLAPFGPDWTAPKGSLLDVAEYVREAFAEAGVDFLIVDSYTTATSTGDSMGGAAAAQEFFEAIVKIGCPAGLVIAHVAGAGNRFPDRPFGSVFVHNLARETWAVEAVENTADVPYDRETDEWQPELVELELRCKKSNVGTKPRPQLLSFEFTADHLIRAYTPQPPRVRIVDRVYDLIEMTGAPMTGKAICAAYQEEYSEPIKAESLRTMLNGDRRFTRETGRKWDIRREAGDEA